MGLKGRLRRALRATAREFDHALTSFEPTSGPSTYPERMVSYYYIQALAKALAPASVLLELPVTGKRGKDNHIDAIIFNNREVVVAEFKRAWTPSHWGDLARDLVRLRGPVAREIRQGFTNNRRRRSYVLLGADCWYRETANAWKSGSPAKRWNTPPPFLAAHRDYLRVFREEGKDYDGYYFTWALIPFDEMAA